MQPIIISDSLSALVTAAAALFVNQLRDDSLPRLWNIIIACIGFVVFTVFALWQAYGFVQDLRTDIILLILLGAGLATHQLYVLYQYIKNISSPLARLLRRDPLATRKLPAVTRANTFPSRPLPEQPGNKSVRFIPSAGEHEL